MQGDPAVSTSTVLVVAAILEACAATGFAIENAGSAADWGKPVKPPREGFPENFSALQRSDIVVAYLGRPLSLGVQVELGMAYALGKPLVVLVDDGVEVPYMVRGLADTGAATVVPFTNLAGLGRDLPRVLSGLREDLHK